MHMQGYMYSASDVNFVISVVCTQLEGNNTVFHSRKRNKGDRTSINYWRPNNNGQSH